MTDPLVFIGVPVFNGEAHLAETLESMRTQTLTSLAVVVADNASTDGTEEIGREFARLDERFTYVRHDRNLGAAPNCNFLHERSGSSRYFKWAAHDDVLAPGYLGACVDALERDPGLVLAHTAPEFIDDDGSLVPYDEEAEAYVDSAGYHWHRDPLRRLDHPEPHVRFAEVVRRTVITQEIFGVMRAAALGPGPHFRSYYGSDRVLLARLALQGGFVELPDRLFLRRCHGQQASQQATTGRAEVVDPERPEAVRFAVGQIVRGYVDAVRRADIGVVSKARCLANLGAHTIDRRTLKKVFVPGPYNYFGIERRRAVAA